ncbi:hypothetical protein MC885_001182 [Smutsia gigantea]|nr:hypothetical protein MC885_021502 [Smutsia gigantea]KAK2505681.1 hypothetical protein MC885_001182 [Smutsia gigantea]
MHSYHSLFKVSPEAWLSSSPSAAPGRLMRLRHASGFSPKPISVMGLRGQQEQQGAQRGDILPSADGAWYLQVSLDVGATEASALSCRVRHGSLGGQDIILHWGEKERGPAGKGKRRSSRKVGEPDENIGILGAPDPRGIKVHNPSNRRAANAGMQIQEAL